VTAALDEQSNTALHYSVTWRKKCRAYSAADASAKLRDLRRKFWRNVRLAVCAVWPRAQRRPWQPTPVKAT
jgi:hypothetical protein